MSGRPSPLPRSAFRIFRPITTRWSDNDVFGHVNNVIYYSWFDTGVTGWLLDNGLLDPVAGDVICVVAETSCTYFSSVAFPERVEVAMAVDRLGRSSVTYRVAIFRQGEPHCCAQGRFTHVYVSRKTRTPVGIPAGVRAAMEPLLG